VVTRQYSYAAWRQRWQDSVGLGGTPVERSGISRSAS